MLTMYRLDGRIQQQQSHNQGPVARLAQTSGLQVSKPLHVSMVVNTGKR